MMPLSPQSLRRGTICGTAGFTLVETLCALALTGLASVALLSLYQTHQEVYRTNHRLMEDQARLRATMGIMVRHLRSAGFDPTERAGAGIVSARADYIYFTRDHASDIPGVHPDGGDGRLSAPGEHIAFCRYGTATLGMHSGRSSGGSCSGTGAQALGRPGMGYHQPLADDLSELAFRYFTRDEDGDFLELLPDPATGEVPEPERIRRIDITLATSFTFRGQERRRALSETVYLRNMEP